MSKEEKIPGTQKVVGEGTKEDTIQLEEQPTDNNSQQSTEKTLQPLTDPQSQISNQKSETENMEVHHHGHVHEKKKWKEYVFQFFMLFLAVFCGFLAEYQLEHIVEHNREKQYIKSFIEDLKTDTAKINSVLEENMQQQLGFDSLMGAIKEPGLLKNPEKFGKYITTIFGLTLFNQTNRTLQQLKNAGGLRLIRSQAASDSIIQYDDRVKEISEQAQDIYNSNQATIGLALQIIDGNSVDNPSINRTLVPKPDKIRLINNAEAKLDEFFNMVLNFKIASFIYCHLLSDLKEYATRQIIFLKKEYRIRDK